MRPRWPWTRRGGRHAPPWRHRRELRRRLVIFSVVEVAPDTEAATCALDRLRLGRHHVVGEGNGLAIVATPRDRGAAEGGLGDAARAEPAFDDDLLVEEVATRDLPGPGALERLVEPVDVNLNRDVRERLAVRASTLLEQVGSERAREDARIWVHVDLLGRGGKTKAPPTEVDEALAWVMGGVNQVLRVSLLSSSSTARKSVTASATVNAARKARNRDTGPPLLVAMALVGSERVDERREQRDDKVDHRRRAQGARELGHGGFTSFPM